MGAKSIKGIKKYNLNAMVTNIESNWGKSDERAHEESIMEWWAVEAFLNSQDKKKQWSLKTVFVNWFESEKDHGSSFIFTLFDQEKHLVYTSDCKREKHPLQLSKTQHHITFDKHQLKGAYPQYELIISDTEKDIQLTLRLQAESLPRWIAEEVTNGWLPVGLGFYRYGFIPKCQVTGTITIKGESFEITGSGYYEHIWGDLWFDNPLARLSGIRKTISLYSKLGYWWFSSFTPRLADRYVITTENSPFGYDWAWAVLDNGWSLFYGNLLMYLAEGPMVGSLILTKDGQTYQEIGDATFTYHQTAYSKHYDFYYPTDLEIRATHQNERLQLRFIMTETAREYVSTFPYSQFWKALVICESPGIIKGTYIKNGEKTPLSGICKIEPQRQISPIGHNQLQLNLIKPPNGCAVQVSLRSHLLKKQMKTELQLLPRPQCKFTIKKIKSAGLHDNRNL